MDALTLLGEDHKALRKLFRTYHVLLEKDADAERREELAARICFELSIHTQIEEEIFYPAVRRQIADDDLMDEALVENGIAKTLIAQIWETSAADALYDAHLNVLGDHVDRHIREVRNELFPTAREALDLEALGKELEERKRELLLESGLLEAGAQRESNVHEHRTGDDPSA